MKVGQTEGEEAGKQEAEGTSAVTEAELEKKLKRLDEELAEETKKVEAEAKQMALDEFCRTIKVNAAVEGVPFTADQNPECKAGVTAAAAEEAADAIAAYGEEEGGEAIDIDEEGAAQPLTEADIGQTGGGWFRAFANLSFGELPEDLLEQEGGAVQPSAEYDQGYKEGYDIAYRAAYDHAYMLKKHMAPPDITIPSPSGPTASGAVGVGYGAPTGAVAASGALAAATGAVAASGAIAAATGAVAASGAAAAEEEVQSCLRTGKEREGPLATHPPGEIASGPLKSKCRVQYFPRPATATYGAPGPSVTGPSQPFTEDQTKLPSGPVAAATGPVPAPAPIQQGPLAPTPRGPLTKHTYQLVPLATIKGPLVQSAASPIIDRAYTLVPATLLPQAGGEGPARLRQAKEARRRARATTFTQHTDLLNKIRERTTVGQA
jgi:hypothetical protein